MTILHSNHSRASAFNLVITIVFDRNLFFENELSTSLPFSNQSIVEQSDGSYILTASLDELSLESRDVAINITARTDVGFGQGRLNSSVAMVYYSSPTSISCSRRSYLHPVESFPESCAASLTAEATSNVQRVVPGQSVVVRVSSVVRSNGKQQMTLVVQLDHPSLPLYNLSNIWQITDAQRGSNKLAL